ncbi:MAG TPA: vitamin B12-dependent ribonucleotide reductase [Actinomycetota bacterium]|nr:vitamin B12-dependent ribonucleotide reductase [Actinomycetota bacterium]
MAKRQTTQSNGSRKSGGEALFSPELDRPDGLHVGRLFTRPDVHPYDEIEWEMRTASIVGRGGHVSFEQREVEFPRSWSQNATNIVAEKYFRGQMNTPQREWSLRQIVDRVVDTIAAWGVEQGRFATEADREAFSSELKHVLVTQRASFNSPVWFNIGVPGRSAQASACFILHVDDSMDSIAAWYRDEMFIFKGGSGSGLNVSNLRSSYEQLAVGGYSSGPVSFMRGADAAAGTIKSGGATRRAAKMVVMNVDHPDVIELRDGAPGFIWCKAVEERKAKALKEAGFDMSVDSGVDGYSIQYQNANNSVRVTDDFMEACLTDADWHLRAVTTSDVIKTWKAREVMRQISQAAWECADPGMQYHTTTNDWHTAPAAGPITASNPCSEYLHLDNSPCNLASLNLLKFLREDGTFDVQSFEHVVKVVLLGQAILCVAADYPTEAIARNARGFRQLGIGYANLGALLMALGIPYESEEGRAWAGAITSLMQATAYNASAQFARTVGAFPGTDDLPGYAHPENRDATLRVLAKHAAFSRALATAPPASDERLDKRLRMFHDEVVGAGEPISRDAELAQVVDRADRVWADCLAAAEQHGVENSQVSVLAPTGTIGFMMDCDTTGVEPDLALKKVKKMVGGGTMSIVNQTVPRALRRLGYNPEQIEAIVEFIDQNNTVVGAPALKTEHYPVFACSFTSDNLITYAGHIGMMAGVQPFLSGGISKTVNLPEDATVEEVERVYTEGWRLGLKALAIYRDNCKADQPLSAAKAKTVESLVSVEAVPMPVRRRLPKARPAMTYSFRVADCDGYVIVGLYPDTQQPGELFIKVAKQGSTLAGVMDAFAISISMGLQYGVPLEAYVEKFMNMTFEPRGITDDPDIRFAASLMDFIFRKLAIEFLPKPMRESLGIRSVSERAEVVNGMNTAPSIEKVGEETGAEAPLSSAETVSRPAVDAPFCVNCGIRMRPAGSCFACESCGSTSGCS